MQKLSILLFVLSSCLASDMLTIGGGTYICSSFQKSYCNDESSIDWKSLATQRYGSQTIIKYDELYQVTSQALKSLESRGVTYWITDDLGYLSSTKQYNADDFQSELKQIDEYFFDDIKDDEWDMVQGYTSVVNTEITSLYNSNKDTITLIDTFIQISGGKGNAYIGIISASSADDKDDYLFYEQIFKEAGAKDVVWIPVDLAYRQAVQEKACDKLEKYLEDQYGQYDVKRRYPSLLKLQQQACEDSSIAAGLLNGITGLFFAGGDQAKHKKSLMNTDGSDTSEMSIIRARHAAGKLAISGSSAGTDVLQGVDLQGKVLPMILGGESYESLKNTPKTQCDSQSCQDDLLYDPTGGLKLFKFGLLDTHFGCRGRQGRMIRLAYVGSGIKLGFGIDEDTAFKIHYDDTQANFQLLGLYGAWVFDFTGAKQNQNSLWGVQNVSTYYLSEGDSLSIKYQPLQLTFTSASWKKQKSKGTRHAQDTSNDIFSSANRQGGRGNPQEFSKISMDLLESIDDQTNGETYETSPEFIVKFIRQSNTKLYEGVDSDGITKKSYENLRLDIAGKSQQDQQQF